MHARTKFEILMIILALNPEKNSHSLELWAYYIHLATQHFKLWNAISIFSILSLTEGASSGICWDTVRVWDPALIGQERPACEMVLHRSRLVEMKGILLMARFTFNSPLVTFSPIHRKQMNTPVSFSNLTFYNKILQLNLSYWKWHLLWPRVCRPSSVG